MKSAGIRLLAGRSRNHIQTAILIQFRYSPTSGLWRGGRAKGGYRPEGELSNNLTPVTGNGQSLIGRSKPIKEFSMKTALDLDNGHGTDGR